ncbi:uncharacterized protein si:ch211-122l24.6 [Ctenopharyngodon idella]|uniref:uncharacterized protein si:ch211-122l24.6 n=1 Tax=Ctenopharyngodon idella TaxID=7959 RepID=UPI0022319251|nr:uncharacterized protein si:ch211-122l24.6 [Ctenopharyngodon idella]
MGSFFSSPLTQQPPYVFDLTESERKEVEEKEDGIFAAFHACNLAICESMYQQNALAKIEEEKFKVYRRYWSGVVEKLKEKYPQWTSEDILNLRFHFEAVTEDYKYLLHFCALDELLELFQVDFSPEQRRAMFDAADTHQCSAINFEGFLQLMNNMNIRTPVPRPAGIEENRDEIMMALSDVAEAHPFTQMSYGLF